MQIDDKHELFVREYLICLNASKAAISAGYKPSYANALMQHPNVQNKLRKAKLEIRAKWHTTIDKLMASNNAVATASLRDFVQSDPSTGRATLKDMSDIPAAKVPALSTLELDDYGQVLKISFKDKVAAIDGSMARMGIEGTDPDLDAIELNTLVREEYAKVSNLRQQLEIEKDALLKERKSMQAEHQSELINLDLARRKFQNCVASL